MLPSPRAIFLFFKESFLSSTAISGLRTRQIPVGKRNIPVRHRNIPVGKGNVAVENSNVEVGDRKFTGNEEVGVARTPHTA
jgi:hypothetical protein